MANGDPIIVTGGGSIEVRLSKATFPPDPGNADRHFNAARSITRVTITDDTTGQVISCPIPGSGKFTVSIEHSL